MRAGRSSTWSLPRPDRYRPYIAFRGSGSTPRSAYALVRLPCRVGETACTDLVVALGGGIAVVHFAGVMERAR